MKKLSVLASALLAISANAYSDVILKCDPSMVYPPPPVSGAQPLTNYSTAYVSDANRFNVVCSDVSAGKGVKKFGVLLGPGPNSTNTVLYSVPKPPTGKTWKGLRFTGTVGDKGLTGNICRGEVSFGAIAVAKPTVSSKSSDNVEYPILTPAGSIAGENEQVYDIVFPHGVNVVQVKIISYSGPNGSTGTDLCDHAFVAEPWWIPN